MIRYEWVAETLDEYGDIVDVTHADTFLQIQHIARQIEADGKEVAVGLVRDRINDVDEDLEDRQWAYLENGVLPKRFDGGATVPKRFLKEVE